jgi:uncharacterized OsmC-like protein
MERDELRAIQAPLKQKYREDPDAALVTLRAEGVLGPNVSCSISNQGHAMQSGLHPATGGSGQLACSGDLLLQALVACAGVTLSAVATSLGLSVQAGTIVAEGDLDFRGTLGVSQEAPVGFKRIRLRFGLEADLTPEQQSKLLELTQRYCVVYQTLRQGAEVVMTL